MRERCPEQEPEHEQAETGEEGGDGGAGTAGQGEQAGGEETPCEAGCEGTGGGTELLGSEQSGDLCMWSWREGGAGGWSRELSRESLEAGAAPFMQEAKLRAMILLMVALRSRRMSCLRLCLTVERSAL